MNTEPDPAVNAKTISAYGGNCPVMGLLKAGMTEHNKYRKKKPDADDSEIYNIYWTYSRKVFPVFGLVPVKPSEEMEDLNSQVIKPHPSDGCSVPFDLFKTVDEPFYDREIACGNHDYCWNVIGHNSAYSLTRDECDDLFADLMELDCANRIEAENCRTSAKLFRVGVGMWRPDFFSGVVELKNTETGMCVTVLSGSTGDGVPIVQEACGDKSTGGYTHQQFRFSRTPPLTVGDKMRYFRIRPAHVLENAQKCVSVLIGQGNTNPPVMQRNCVFLPQSGGSALSHTYPHGHAFFALKSVNGGNTYTIRNSLTTDRCWVPASNATGQAIVNAPCDVADDLFHWYLKEVPQP